MPAIIDPGRKTPDCFGWVPRWSVEQINERTLERPELRSHAGAWERSSPPCQDGMGLPACQGGVDRAGCLNTLNAFWLYVIMYKI